MPTIEKKNYIVKYIDELGNCYNETICNFKDKQLAVRTWKGEDKMYIYLTGDITVYQKDCGEELWIYES